MQAAGRTTIDEHNGGSSDGSRARVASPSSWVLFISVAVVMIAVDQIAKVLAVRHLAGEPDKQVVGELLQLHLTYNPGAAFSLGTRFTVAISLLAIVATGVVLWISLRAVSKLWALGLGLMLAGIDGNLLDRIFREPGPFKGHVVDFLMLPNWPVFNVADICINIGVVVILIQVLRGIDLAGAKVQR